MSELQPVTQVYVIRIWRISDNGPGWRGVILNPRTKESVAVSNLDPLEELIRQYFRKIRKSNRQRTGGLK